MDQQLLNRIRQCESLPTLPAVAVQVLELVRDPRSELTQLARLVSKDPALASKILRTANSTIYCRPKKVSKLTEALSVLGLQTVRVLVLGFSLVRNLRNYKNRGFRPLDYWKRAIYSATAALTLAQRIHLELQEEAFVAALLMDLGMLVLDEVLGEQYGQINGKARTHNELFKLEESLLQATHAEVSGLMADTWGIPQVLAVPMATHHNPTSVQDPKLRQLAHVCYLAGRCADVFVEESAAMAIGELREHCLREYQLIEADCDGLLNQISRRTGEIAPLFDITINATVSYETVLKKANDSIIQMTLADQEQTRRERRNMEAQVWIDPLTRLANRLRLDAMISEHFAASPAKLQPLSLVLIRIDHFEQIRQEQGQAGADAAVKQLAQHADKSARSRDLVARFDHDTVGLLLPSASRAQAVALAESIRRDVHAAPIDVGRVTFPITVSGGVASVETETPFKEPAHLIKAAELALEAAKSSGGNRVRAFSRCKSSVPPSAAA